MPILQQIKVPLVSVNDTSLTVVDILFAHGAAVKTGDNLLLLETSKTTYDVVAEADGFIGYDCIKDEDYAVNEVIAHIYSDVLEVPLEQIIKKRQTEITGQQILAFDGETIFSTAALALMQVNDISKTAFAGKDFVSKAMVEELLGIAHTGIALNKTKRRNFIRQDISVDDNKVTVQKLSKNKRREIDYLSAVQSTGLTSTIYTYVDTAGIFLHINQSMRFLKNALLPAIIYETARLLLKYKLLNAYFAVDAIALYKEVNIGFAIDMGKGLKVVKVQNATIQSLTEIEDSIMALSNKYLDDNLHVNDLTDISFAITDLSAETVSFFKPLVNNRNSAILGISSIDKKLNRCTLSLTFDHRVTEGKTAAQFLHELKDRLESYQSKYYPLLNQDINCFKCFKQLKDDLSDVGFSKCITPKGEEAYICQSCFKGF